MLPPSHFSLNDPSFADIAKNIRFLGIDFDGVMTDNTVFVLEDGREAVRCSRLEGFGIKRLSEAGIFAAIISTEKNPVVSARAAKLNLPCHQNVSDKVATVSTILDEKGLSWDQAAFIGNDINDAAILTQVRLPIVVADAHESLNEVSAFRTNRRGGDGAVRELCDAIAIARNE